MLSKKRSRAGHGITACFHAVSQYGAQFSEARLIGLTLHPEFHFNIHDLQIGEFCSCAQVRVVAQDTVSYIGKMIADAGGSNALRLLEQPYPILSMEHIVMLNPDILIAIMHNGVEAATFPEKVLKEFPYLKISKNKSIYTLDPLSICYYTPRDYINAVTSIANIIKETFGTPSSRSNLNSDIQTISANGANI